MHMNVRYKKDRKLSDALLERAEKKMDHIALHLEEDHPVHVILSSEKEGDIAEVSLHYKGHDIFAKSVGKNMFESLDEATANACRQFEKIFEKLKGHRGMESVREEHTLPTRELVEDE